MLRKRLGVASPIETLHQRLLLQRRVFAHLLDFVFNGVGWRNPWQWDCEVYFDVPRSYFTSDAKGRPGDIDLVLIPCAGKSRFFDEAVALEVKSYRVRRSNRDKSPGDSGSRQVRGLFEMGFPFVGLLHVVVLERGDAHERAMIPLYTEGKRYPPGTPPDEFIEADLASLAFKDRQEGRSQKLDIPQCAGLKTFATTEQADGTLKGHSVGWEREPSRNPNVSADLIERLGSLSQHASGMRVGYPRPTFRTQSIKPKIGAIHV